SVREPGLRPRAGIPAGEQDASLEGEEGAGSQAAQAMGARGRPVARPGAPSTQCGVEKSEEELPSPGREVLEGLVADDGARIESGHQLRRALRAGALPDLRPERVVV